MVFILNRQNKLPYTLSKKKHNFQKVAFRLLKSDTPVVPLVLPLCTFMLFISVFVLCIIGSILIIVDFLVQKRIPNISTFHLTYLFPPVRLIFRENIALIHQLADSTKM